MLTFLDSNLTNCKLISRFQDITEIHEDESFWTSLRSSPPPISLPNRFLNQFAAFRKRICINFPTDRSAARAEKDVGIFILTGNLEPPDGHAVSGINPTLVFPDQNRCMDLTPCTPFDAYFPIPLEDQLSMSEEQDLGGPFLYCKSKLQSLITELRSNKHRVVFNFHFTTDCVALCLQNKDLHNKFHVIHCSDFADEVGLANLLPAVTDCLIQDTPESFILTETTRWVKFQKATIAEYVELVLGCPLSMIPTVYGLKLTNHLRLGSPVCVSQHDLTSTNPVTLKWLRAPVAYSSNIPLSVSPALKETFNQLSQFILWRRYISPDVIGDQRLEVIAKMWLPYTPLTLFYILQSLAKRCQWTQGAIESLLDCDVIPASLQLAWRTQLAWLKGKPLLRLTSSKNWLDVYGRGFTNNSSLLLVSKQVKSRLKRPKGEYYNEHFIATNFLADAHCIDHLGWNKNIDQFVQMAPSVLVDPLDRTISFLLAMDHGCDKETLLAIFDYIHINVGCIPLLDNFQSKIVVNSSPSLTCPPPLNDIATTCGLYVINCLESGEDYQMEIGIKSHLIINNICGSYFNQFNFHFLAFYFILFCLLTDCRIKSGHHRPTA